MILDRLDNWALYFDPQSPMGRAFEYLTRDFDPAAPDGRIDIEGDDIFALVQTVKTKTESEARFEAHKTYADIQLLLTGAEGMGWAPVNELEVDEPYSEEKDVAFYKSEGMRTRLEVYKNHFAVFYPNDAHAPCLRLGQYKEIKKVVVKVRI